LSVFVCVWERERERERESEEGQQLLYTFRKKEGSVQCDIQGVDMH
jgi:hypothetical protein